MKNKEEKPYSENEDVTIIGTDAGTSKFTYTGENEFTYTGTVEISKKKEKVSIKEYWSKNKPALMKYFEFGKLKKTKIAVGVGIIGLLIWFASHIYPSMLLAFTIIPLFLIPKVKDHWSWFEFSWMVLFCSIGGYIWMDDIMFYDKVPVWGYTPFNVSWIEPWAGAILEDVLFYPVTAFGVYVVYLFIRQKNIKDFKYKDHINFSLFLLNWIIVYFFWSHTKYFSDSTMMLFSIISLPMWLYCFKEIHVKKFVYFIIFGLIFGGGMNFIGVDLFRLFGLDWGIGWWYGYGSKGRWIASNVFMNKEHNPGYWILSSPWSVPFFLSWAGIIFYVTVLETWRNIKSK